MNVGRLRAVIGGTISRANRELEYASLAGLDPAERGEHPYDTIAGALREGLADIEALREHTHEWGDGGFCAICGADGNA